MKHTKPPQTATGKANEPSSGGNPRVAGPAFRGWPLILPTALLAVACLLAACSGGSNASPTSSSASSPGQPTKLRLLTHDSFALSDDTLAAFTNQTGIEVEVVKGQDTGSLVSQIILTRGNPVADVVFGVDNTFLGTAAAAGVFEPYQSAEPVKEELLAGANGQVTPIDYGDVCINYWKDAFIGDAAGDAAGDAPTSLEDLTEERYRGKLVVQHPETSSPGLAFLLATIARFGQDGWEDYWRQLRANDVLVTSGWSEAYYTHFSAGGGGAPAGSVLRFQSSSRGVLRRTARCRSAHRHHRGFLLPPG